MPLRLRSIPFACLGLVLTSLASASGPAATPPAETRPVAIAANSILADIAREIAGDSFEIHPLVPAGVDAHAFEPRPADVAVLTTARLFIANGAGLEPWLEKLVSTSGFHGEILHASDGCTLITHGNASPPHTPDPSAAHTHDHGDGIDPHAWHDPRNGMRYVANIRDALIRTAPAAEAETYRRRARLYSAQLEATHAWSARLFATVTTERRRIITSHDSLAYLGRAYQITIVPVRGLDTRQEPDARAYAALVDSLRTQNTRALFVESVSNPKMLEQLARDTGASIGGELFTDSVGPGGSPAATYLGMLRENTLRILAALEAN